MKYISRREFVSFASLSAVVGRHGTGFCSQFANYLQSFPAGRALTSLGDAKGAKPGDAILIRDMAQLASEGVWTREESRGKWHLRPYQLADGQVGNLLMINDWAKDDGPSAVPPIFEVKLDLPGWYSIWVGIPRMNLRPVTYFPLDGVDIALDDDPAFVPLVAERGTGLVPGPEKYRLMGPMDVEIKCFWKCAKLDGRTLRVRVPTGTFQSGPFGLVRGAVSSLRLVKLNDQQIAAYQADVSNLATKRVIVVHDGNSDILCHGEPETGVEARFATAYRNSDVKMLIYQAITNGVATWPSKVTTLLGDGMTEQLWALRRRMDRRGTRYVQWAVQHGQEPIKVVSQLCRRFGIQCHAGMRMNQLFPVGSEGRGIGEWLNGGWWRQHPELRKPGKPDLDYAKPPARQYMIDLLMELATNYDVDGLSLDFTRWAPIADLERHSLSVLTNFVQEIRQALDKVARSKGRKLALSAMLVDGHIWKLTLLEQRIDLEAWLAAGYFDFVCLEAWEPTAKYIALAKRYNTPYYSIQDNESFKQNDPEWEQKRPEDEWASQEMLEQPFTERTLDPTEYDQGFLQRYRLGADGACLVNNMWGWRSTGRLGHIDEMAARVKSREVWGQEVGPALHLRELSSGSEKKI